jgi:hypothetical protein
MAQPCNERFDLKIDLKIGLRRRLRSQRYLTKYVRRALLHLIHNLTIHAQ